MGELIKLVPVGVSSDTEAAAEYILSEVRRRRFIGLAYIGIRPAREYVIDLAGEAKSAPLFAHSLAAILAYELIELHRGRRR